LKCAYCGRWHAADDCWTKYPEKRPKQAREAEVHFGLRAMAAMAVPSSYHDDDDDDDDDDDNASCTASVKQWKKKKKKENWLNGAQTAR